MKRILRPGSLLLVQAILLAAALLATGRLQPEHLPDTRGYEEFPFSPITESLQHPRTFGYPLFLRCVRRCLPMSASVPIWQFIFHVLAVGLFWIGLRKMIRSPWTSMAIASSLLYSNVVMRYINCVTPDSLASSLSIASIGCLLLVVKRPGIVWYWIALGTSVFASYQLRPAYLFLVPLVPLLGTGLWWLLSSSPDSNRHDNRSPALRLAAVAMLPLLLFCCARWFTVGQFGLVSFGGNNFAGVTTRFLDDDRRKVLPDQVQPLAKEVLLRRRSAAERHAGFSDGVTRSYAQIESGFDVETWEVCVPAAQAIYGEDWYLQNRGMSDLASAIVRSFPTDYGIWLVKAFVRGIYMITSEVVANPIYFLLLAGLLFFHTRYVLRRCSCGPEYRESDEYRASSNSYFLEINALWLIAMSFALVKILAVIVTTPPLGRFMDPAGVFLVTVIVRALSRRIELGRLVGGDT